MCYHWLQTLVDIFERTYIFTTG